MLVLKLINSASWFERLTMTVILVNCVTLGMYQPCEDTTVCDQKCKLLKVEACHEKYLSIYQVLCFTDNR